jgi:hypothetical protein
MGQRFQIADQVRLKLKDVSSVRISSPQAQQPAINFTSRRFLATHMVLTIGAGRVLFTGRKRAGPLVVSF